MTDYAALAATYLKRAAGTLEDGKFLAEARQRDEYHRLADAYTRLAAIEKGLPPGFGGHAGAEAPE
jgi:hypothetical protein